MILDLDANPYLRGLAKAGAGTSAFVKQLDTADSRMSNLVQTALALTPALVPIGAAGVTAVTGLATQLGFAAAGAGVAALAFNGVGDALEALNEYQLEPSAENLEKLNEAMRGLGPEAQEFVRYLDQIIPQLQTLRETAQAGLLPGVQEGLDALLDRLPQVRDIIGEVAEAAGDLASQAGEALSSDRFDAFFDYLESEARPALMTFGQTVGNVFEALANTWMALDPLSDDFGQGLLDFTRGLAEASRDLESSPGFQKFLAYVQENGPQAVETLGAIGEAFVALVKAAAPIGAVTLPIIEAVAKVFTALVESPAGPVLIGAAAGLSAVSRAVALFNAANGSAMVATLTGVGRTGAAAGAGAGAAASGLSRLNMAVAGLKTGASTIGIMAVAMSDLDDKAGLSNTAMFTMAGTLAGPWGAAAGAGLGLTLDLVAAHKAWAASIQAADAAMKAMDLAAMQAAMARLNADVAEQGRLVTALAVVAPGLVDNYLEWSGNAEKTGTKMGQLSAAIKRAKAAQEQQNMVLGDSVRSLEFETQALEQNIAAMREKRNMAIQGKQAEINYQAALDAARQSLKENGRTMDITTQKGRNNRQAMLDLASSWNNQTDAVKSADGAHKRAIDTFVKVFGHLFKNEKKARDYARSIYEIPSDWETKIHAEAGQAFRTINGVKVALRNLDGTVSTTYIRTVRSEHMANRLDRGRADGGIDYYAAGGIRPKIGDQQPQIQPNQGPRGITWAETGAGPWEAFISGHPAKKERSRNIADEVVSRLGGAVAWKAADGMMLARQAAPVSVAAPSVTVQPDRAAVAEIQALRGQVAELSDRVQAIPRNFEKNRRKRG